MDKSELRSVLTGLLDITPAMDKAGESAVDASTLSEHPDDGGGTYLDCDAHKAIFKAMIEAALRELPAA